MLQDPNFWVLVAFVIFVVVVWKRASVALTGLLDQRAEKIRAELREAQTLREEAEKVLADTRKRQQEALDDAARIIAHAKDEAERLRARSTADLEDQLKRREAQALEKIAQAETQALHEVRNLTVDLAVAASGRILATELKPAQADALVDTAIAELGRSLH